MKSLLIIGLGMLAACSAGPRSTTMHFSSREPDLYLITGERCEQSGFLVDADREFLTTFYYNCSILTKKKLDERERNQW